MISSETSSLTPVMIFSVEIPGRLPSWNEILGMEQWARYKYKNELAAEFLSGLRHTGTDSSTKIISAKNTTSIYAATLESYLAMKQEKRKLKLAKSKQFAAKKSASSSKSSSFHQEPKRRPETPVIPKDPIPPTFPEDNPL
jgi:hypothetical protein